MRRHITTQLLAALFLVSGFLIGCGGNSQSNSSNSGYTVSGENGNSYSDYYDDEIIFLDEANSQTAPEVGVSELTFTSTSGEQMAVGEYGDGDYLVLIMTRGNTKPICPFCSTQTANYIRDYQQFKDRNTEVVLVYPVEEKKNTEKFEGFLESVRAELFEPMHKVPFPVVFDVELSAVDRLGIRKDLSKPATYILDSSGRVRYTYVGAHWGDRPSTKLILSQLNELAAADGNSETTTSEVQPDVAQVIGVSPQTLVASQ